jgi:hypothetical protein
MKLVLHIVAKDARRFWLMVFLWLGLFTLYLFSAWRLEHALPNESREVLTRLKFIGILTFVVHVLTEYIFAAMLVLEDPAVGTSTFWPTRPIAGGRLFVAKVLSCVLWFGGFALCLALPSWTAAGLSSAEVVSRATALLYEQAWIILTAFVIASFSGSVEKFLGWSLAFILLMGAVVLSVGGTSMLAVSFEKWDPVAIMTSRATRINIVGAIIALLLQYQTRRRSVALWGVAAFAALVFAWEAIA